MRTALDGWETCCRWIFLQDLDVASGVSYPDQIQKEFMVHFCLYSFMNLFLPGMTPGWIWIRLYTGVNMCLGVVQSAWENRVFPVNRQAWWVVWRHWRIECFQYVDRAGAVSASSERDISNLCWWIIDCYSVWLRFTGSLGAPELREEAPSVKKKSVKQDWCSVGGERSLRKEPAGSTTCQGIRCVKQCWGGRDRPLWQFDTSDNLLTPNTCNVSSLSRSCSSFRTRLLFQNSRSSFFPSLIRFC